jgi:hypothetical protein
MTQRTRPSHIARWPWWKVLGLGAFAFGMTGSLMAIASPFPSVPGLIVGLSLGLVATMLLLVYWRTNHWWARVIFAEVWTLQLVGAGVGLATHVFPLSWTWLLPLAAVYLAALALPIVAPRTSRMLVREQAFPRTRLGRGCLAVSLALLPIGGILGASVGMNAGRFGWARIVIPFGALVLIVGATAYAHNIMHDSWRQRPSAGGGEWERAEDPRASG